MNDIPLTLLKRAAALAGQSAAVARLDEARRAVRQDGSLTTPVAVWAALWRAAGLEGEPAPLTTPEPADLPCLVWQAERGWLILHARRADGRWQAEGADGQRRTLESLQGASCVRLPRRRQGQAATAPRALPLVLRAVWARKAIYGEAMVATALVNLLALATSLYAMQVFDRVIPNQGFQTLWVLTVGVLLAIGLELMLKHVRSRMVERANTAIDQELSAWTFGRLLHIRMESRPASVGTLAAQVKGFELVRGVLTSASLFVLVDVPFAALFVAIIGFIGGWMVVVPLIALPLALAVGVLFQRAITRHTRQNLAGANRKAGLLVEAVDGAESLKAQGGEWKLLGRWNRLVQEVGQSEERMRRLTATAQNLSAALQQTTYVALMALGAYLATENLLTTGGLLACSILSNRAMAPIVQLPQVMLQWAHARTAIEELDKVIALPSESDEVGNTLNPGTVEPRLRFERVRFAYGTAGRNALEIAQLQIRAGERVGLVGAIGSGKSTLLKLASGLYRPASGKVYLGDLDIALVSPAVLRETIGYLPQDVRLFSGTLRDNLLLGLPDPGDEAILEAARRTGLIDLIRAQPKGLALEITEGGRGVSGGQKQLIALTRLLLAKPKVWLLDEPTGAMDAVTEARIVALLKEAAQAGATLLVSTHKTALLPLLDRLIVLHEGRIVLDGPREQVLAKLAQRPAGAKAAAAAAVGTVAAVGGQA